MADVKTYDVSDATGGFDAHTFSGLEPGTFFKFEPNNSEPRKMKEGADGETAFIVSHFGGGKGMITLMHTSDSNRVLLAKFYSKTKGVFQFEDSLGNRVVSRVAMLQGVPALEAADADGPGGREWVFLMSNVIIKAPLVATPL